ncbi:MAG: hypothetical protein OXD37_02600 [Acidimicrobiaceae bacterium]|nr:hypothetical protein [Acidimicrobiaceae bacterium]
MVVFPGGGTARADLLDSGNNVVEGGKKLDVSWDEVTSGSPAVRWFGG